MFRLKPFLMTASLVGSLFGFACGPVSAQVAPVQPGPSALQGPEQRVALVIGNSNYKNAPQLQNPDNDAESMAQFLNSAGFEVVAATDLTQNDMLRVVQDFSAKVSARGPNTVAMVYYAGHGVQLAGENYLVPVDAKVSNPTELVSNSVRLVDVMSTLETIPSRMRIVILDACRNNPFPDVNDAGRGLAIVDAPNGSIVGYSTAPGAEAQDGTNGHSPYTQAFLNVAREPNVPIEQLFKRVRLEVNQSTSGAQIPWESSSLTSDFTFFGDTAVAATRAPVNTPVVQMASNLPSRSTRQAYDYVVSEGRPEYYQEFIQMYPHDPLCDHIRWLLNNLLITQAWHKAVLANSPLGYKSFYDGYGNSPYAQSALKLQAQPKLIPLMQATKFLAPQNIAPTFKVGNLGQPKYMPLMQQGNGGAQMNGNLPVVQKPVDSNVLGKLGNGGQVVNLPAGNNQPNGTPSQTPGKIVTLPAPTNTTNTNGGTGKIVTLPATNNTPNGGGNNNGTTNGTTKGTPGKIVSMPVNAGKGGTAVDKKPVVQTQNNPIRVNNGNTGIVKLNNNPVNKVQVQNNQQNNRPQFNATNRVVNNGGNSNNFRQSMNQAPSMGGGNNHRGIMR
ncbi:caspase family protein [Bradyrhizobium japonicum]|uniref:caspase family protein n=1 Tax=Bradyrhizobium japonicum TaxID=375 RepID=UPI00057D23E7|nr:caspase family protein [Bradyrhizobium japonicum]MCD9108463.1 caspase family protein [Bradyrhizobium japonicum]MCD9257548.1 caspase family protein [Bradyrhizobium japonicum SEMIA 5079]MCD9823761.1 caspase family protein [Bradyrhizobium japonicum]MCD9896057.1 caspase family protein [Bradyrhizobium japonicum]MCD9906790.1 caspase family protein [Bradyrhizobium japonicum]